MLNKNVFVSRSVFMGEFYDTNEQNNVNLREFMQEQILYDLSRGFDVTISPNVGRKCFYNG